MDHLEQQLTAAFESAAQKAGDGPTLESVLAALPRDRQPRRFAVGVAAAAVAAAVAVAGVALAKEWTAPAPAPKPAPTSVPSQRPSPSPSPSVQSLWSQIGPGWFLVVHGDAAADPTTDLPAHTKFELIDPSGKAHLVVTLGGGAQVVAWSGDGIRALVDVENANINQRTRQVLDLRTGSLSTPTLPARTTAIGFTRPTGLGLLTTSPTANEDPSVGPTFQIERRALTGANPVVLATSLPSGYAAGSDPTSFPASVVYNFDGSVLLIGEPQGVAVVGNATGVVERVVGTPGCHPLRMWDAGAVLARCTLPLENGVPQGNLSVFPLDGTPGRVVTRDGGDQYPGQPAGQSSGLPTAFDAYQLPDGVYTTSNDACGATWVGKVDPATTFPDIRVTLPWIADNSAVVAARGAEIAVKATRSCGGPPSMTGVDQLYWFNPVTRGHTMLWTSPRDQQAQFVPFS